MMIKDIAHDCSMALFEGGAGSGNWGHKGRPGKRGGSLPGGGVSAHAGSNEKYGNSPSLRHAVDRFVDGHPAELRKLIADREPSIELMARHTNDKVNKAEQMYRGVSMPEAAFKKLKAGREVDIGTGLSYTSDIILAGAHASYNVKGGKDRMVVFKSFVDRSQRIADSTIQIESWAKAGSADLEMGSVFSENIVRGGRMRVNSINDIKVVVPGGKTVAIKLVSGPLIAKR